MRKKKMLQRWIIVAAAVLVLALLVALISREKAPEVTDETPGSSQTQSSTDSQGNVPALTYEEYQAMSGEERQAFFDSFDSMDDFLLWLNEAKAAYEESKNENAINGDNPIDIGDLINGNS